MTSPVLRVIPIGLRELAQRCGALADVVAPSLPAVTTATWQASGAAASTANAGASKSATAMRGRMTASSNRLSTAAREYETMDTDGAAALVRVGFTPLVPRGSGADGGAAGAFGKAR